VQVMTDINSYLDFVLKLFLAFGIAFEMPIAAVILIWTGVTTLMHSPKNAPISSSVALCLACCSPHQMSSRSHCWRSPCGSYLSLAYFSADYYNPQPRA